MFEQKAEKIIANTSDLQKVGSKFTNYLQSTYSIQKLTKKLQNWHELNFSDFIKELNKAIKTTNKERSTNELALIPTLTKSDEIEWMVLFDTKKTEA